MASVQVKQYARPHHATKAGRCDGERGCLTLYASIMHLRPCYSIAGQRRGAFHAAMCFSRDGEIGVRWQRTFLQRARSRPRHVSTRMPRPSEHLPSPILHTFSPSPLDVSRSISATRRELSSHHIMSSRCVVFHLAARLGFCQSFRDLLTVGVAGLQQVAERRVSW